MSPEQKLAERLAAFDEVERVILFGSRARGDAGFRADIDLAVEAPTASIQRWFDIEEAAEEAPTLLMIDLVRLDTAPPELVDVIRKEGQILCERRRRETKA
jgi:predicted nucleotidyltransferase